MAGDGDLLLRQGERQAQVRGGAVVLHAAVRAGAAVRAPLPAEVPPGRLRPLQAHRWPA